MLPGWRWLEHNILGSYWWLKIIPKPGHLKLMTQIWKTDSYSLWLWNGNSKELEWAHFSFPSQKTNKMPLKDPKIVLKTFHSLCVSSVSHQWFFLEYMGPWTLLFLTNCLLYSMLLPTLFNAYKDGTSLNEWQEGLSVALLMSQTLEPDCTSSVSSSPDTTKRSGTLHWASVLSTEKGSNNFTFLPVMMWFSSCNWMNLVCKHKQQVLLGLKNYTNT